MCRLTASILALASIACIGCGQTPAAGDPPGGDQMRRRVTFDANEPRAVVNPAGGWTVTANGKYQYDPGQKFKEMRVELMYAKGADSPVGRTHKFTDESTIAPPGTFMTEFGNLRPPVEGEVLTLRAVLVTTTPAGVEVESSSTRTVAAPK